MKLIKRIFNITTIIVLFMACDSNVEINASVIEPPIVANFQVDFDGKTWVAENKTAIITNGEITITATANEEKEIVVINLLSNKIGVYNISPLQDVGSISYNNTDEEFGFFESDFELLGGIILEENDIESQLLSGKFFFNGGVLVQQFNDDGTPVTIEIIDEITGDVTIEEVFDLETKEFTNGIFEKIIYTFQ